MDTQRACKTRVRQKMIKPDTEEWKLGSPPQDAEKDVVGKDDNVTMVIFPITIQSMYTQDNYTYCTCIKCKTFTERGFVTLIFKDDHWGIRVVCTACHTPASPQQVVECRFLILELQNKLAPLLKLALDTHDSRCLVCEKKRCKNPECKEILETHVLYENDEQLLLEHFYRIRLNLHTALLPPHSFLCFYCGRKQGTRSCATCKMYIYCSKGCKKKASREGHPCNPFWEVWRL